MDLQLMSCHTEQSQHNNAQMIAGNALFNSAKRKLDEDTEFRSVKRTQFSSRASTTKEEESRPFALPNVIAYNKPPSPFQLSATATANFGHSNDSIGVFTPPVDEEQEDIMMIDDDLTDEEESLKTPCNTNYDYIPTDLGENVDDGGYSGQLESGWSDMYNEYNI